MIKYQVERFQQRIERHIRPLPQEHRHGVCAEVMWDLWQREAWHAYYWSSAYMWLVTICILAVNLGNLSRLNWVSGLMVVVVVMQITLTRTILRRQRQRIEALQSGIAPKVRDYVP